MGNTLFELVGDMQSLYEMAIDPECDPEMLEGSIESVMGLIEVKAGGYVNVLKQLEMEQKQAEALAQAFTDKANVRKNNIKRMKEALKIAMQKIGETQLDAGDYTIKLQNNGGQAPLVIDHPEDVPENMTKITIEADNAKIREFLESPDGKKCKWAHIAERGQHIVIK